MPRRLRSARTNRKYGQAFEFGSRSRLQGICARYDNRAPRSSESGGDRLDPHQRRDQHLVPERLEGGCGALTIGLRAGDDDAHGSIEESWSCTVLELASCLSANNRGILAFARACDVMCRATVGMCDQSAKLHSIPGHRRISGDWSLAGTVKCAEKCPLASHSRRRIRVIDLAKNIAHAFVVFTGFNADRALADGRQELLGAHNNDGSVGKAEPLHSG